MDRDFEITKEMFGHYRLRRKSDDREQSGIYFRKNEVSDIIHELMFYCDEAP